MSNARSTDNGTRQGAVGASPPAPPMLGVPNSATGLIDLGRLRLSQDFDKELGVTKALTTVPVRKPDRFSFVRVHPAAEYRLDTLVLTLKGEGATETYLVDPGLRSDLAGELIPTALFTVITRQGVLLLWPIRLPDQHGRIDHWNRSALEAAKLAMEKWVRVAANMGLGGYDVFVPTGSFAEPVWPDVSFQELVEVAFRDHFIQDRDHVVLRKLRGEI